MSRIASQSVVTNESFHERVMPRMNHVAIKTCIVRHVTNESYLKCDSCHEWVTTESCPEWVISRMSHVAIETCTASEICHEWVTLQMRQSLQTSPVTNESYRTTASCHEQHMSQMIHVTNEFCHEWVKSHISQVSPLITNDSCRKRVMSRTSSVTNKFCHVLSRISHVTSCHEWVMSNSAMEESRHEPGLTERRRGCAGLARTKLAPFTCTLSLRNMSTKSTAASSCVSTHNI